jgi:hypothetical protein
MFNEAVSFVIRLASLGVQSPLFLRACTSKARLVPISQDRRILLELRSKAWELATLTLLSSNIPCVLPPNFMHACSQTSTRIRTTGLKQPRFAPCSPLSQCNYQACWNPRILSYRLLHRRERAGYLYVLQPHLGGLKSQLKLIKDTGLAHHMHTQSSSSWFIKGPSSRL